MPKPRGDVEISSFYSFLLTLHLPNQKDPHPATYKFIDPIDSHQILA